MVSLLLFLLKIQIDKHLHFVRGATVQNHIPATFRLVPSIFDLCAAGRRRRLPWFQTLRQQHYTGDPSEDMSRENIKNTAKAL